MEIWIHGAPNLRGAGEAERADPAASRRGRSWASIAEEVELTERRCRGIWKARTPFELAADTGPFEGLPELLESLYAAIEDCAELGATTDKEYFALAAIHKRVELQLKVFELKREYGLVARGVGDAEIKAALQAVLDVLAKADLDEEHQRELTDALASAQTHWLVAQQPSSRAA